MMSFTAVPRVKANCLPSRDQLKLCISPASKAGSLSGIPPRERLPPDAAPGVAVIKGAPVWRPAEAIPQRRGQR